MIVLILGSVFLAVKLGKKKGDQDTITSEGEQPEGEGQSEEGEHEYAFTGDWMDGQGVLVYGRPPVDYLSAVNSSGVT